MNHTSPSNCYNLDGRHWVGGKRKIVKRYGPLGAIPSEEPFRPAAKPHAGLVTSVKPRIKGEL